MYIQKDLLTTFIKSSKLFVVLPVCATVNKKIKRNFPSHFHFMKVTEVNKYAK